MGLKVVYGRAGSGKTEFCFNDINKNLECGKKIFVVTPAQFSFTAEKKLMESINSIVNVEILTFERMAYRILNEVGGCINTNLTNCGKSMLIYNILNKNLKELNFLNKSDENIEIISNSITEFKKHNITVEDLKSELDTLDDKFLNKKLTDVLRVYEQYNSKIEDNYIDENDLLTILSDNLNYTNEYKNSIIYIDEFSGFTNQEYKIISTLLDFADITITVCSDSLEESSNPDIDIFYDNKKTIQRLFEIASEKNIKVETINLGATKRFKTDELVHLEKNLYMIPYEKYLNDVENINLFLANNQFTEVNNVAKTIIKLVKKYNCKFNEISVITNSLSTYSNLIKVVFNKFKIPYFMDSKKDLNQNPVIKYLLSILDIFNKNWSYESVFNYIKSGFLDIDYQEISKLENYCINWGIKGSKWYKEDWDFGNYDKKDLERLNEIRKQIIVPLVELKNKLYENKNIKNFCNLLYNFLVENNIEEKLTIKSDNLKSIGLIELSKEYLLGWNILINVFDELILIFNDEKMSMDEFIKILKVGIKNSELGLIPSTLDQVIIGDVDRSRSHKVKYVFLIGLNDGVFPSINKSEGFINDADRELLKCDGLELAKGTLDKLYETNFNIYKAFTTAENELFLSYASSDIEGKSLRPSILINKIKKIFPKISEESDILEKNYEILTLDSTFESLLENMQDFIDGKKIDDIWFEVYNYYFEKEDWKDKLIRSMDGLKYTNNPEKIKKDLIDKLYGNNIKTSISKLERYRSCPFSYHLQYGLNLKDLRKFEIKSIDTGSFMHEVIDEFFSYLTENCIDPKEVEEEKLKEIVNNIIDEKLSLNKNYIFSCTPKFRNQTNRLKHVIMQSIEFIISELKVSEFHIIGNEVEFGDNKKYKPIKIELDDNKRVEIVGKIDRIDMARYGKNNFVRIIDYKSSIKDINLNEFVAGLQIQLLTYLDATCKVEDMIPAGVLYFNLIDAIADKRLSDEDIKNEIKKQFKMKGLILADVNIVKMMDKNLYKGFSDVVPAYIDSKGNISDGRSSVVSKEEFEKLQNYTIKILKDISSEIMSGSIDLKPYYKIRNNRTPCEFCDYSSICQFNKGFCGNGYNYIYNLKKNEVLNKIN